MKGRAYVFLRKDGAPLPPGNGGHVGWGFECEDGAIYCGSTENSGGSLNVPAGGDNGWWGAQLASKNEMLLAMQGRNYDGFKVATVRDPKAVDARRIADDTKDRGYRGLGNNCLDHVWDILKAYGVQDLPWAQTHPSPSDWFAVFNGEYKNL